ncbi:MAG: RNA polymerase sigma-70 factor [Dysgonamonadaceae bacterium]|jgi:RNA polymerase sigma-70 factor (ECF subfamily)|nr:RNA polymerase sigma-70 factor [Dysgonamonadaceae bacterium]
MASGTDFFDQLFSEYRQQFVRFAYFYLRDFDVAEDITVDAFLYYWENRHSLTSVVNVPAYILTIVKHKSLNHLEHLKVRQGVEKQLIDEFSWELSMRIASLKSCEPEEVFSEEIRCIVRKTLSELPSKTREIFRLSRKQNLTYKEIADRMGISVKVVEFHISKAIRALRISLRDYICFLPFFIKFL